MIKTLEQKIQELTNIYEEKKDLIASLKDKKAIDRHESDLVEIGARIELLEAPLYL